jgi:hypothetical protein
VFSPGKNACRQACAAPRAREVRRSQEKSGAGRRHRPAGPVPKPGARDNFIRNKIPASGCQRPANQRTRSGSYAPSKGLSVDTIACRTASLPLPAPPGPPRRHRRPGDPVNRRLEELDAALYGGIRHCTSYTRSLGAHCVTCACGTVNPVRRCPRCRALLGQRQDRCGCGCGMACPVRHCAACGTALTMTAPGCACETPAPGPLQGLRPPRPRPPGPVRPLPCLGSQNRGLPLLPAQRRPRRIRRTQDRPVRSDRAPPVRAPRHQAPPGSSRNRDSIARAAGRARIPGTAPPGDHPR